LKYLFGKIAFNFKIFFQLLEILCFKNILGWKFLVKYYTVSNRVNFEKGIILTHRFYFLIAQAFLFLMKNIVLNVYTVLFKKISQNVFIIGFHNNQKCEL